MYQEKQHTLEEVLEMNDDFAPATRKPKRGTF